MKISLIGMQPFQPTTIFGEGWSIWKGSVGGNGLDGAEEMDGRILGYVEFDLTRIVLESCMAPSESHIGGEEKLRRLKALPQMVRLGGNVCIYLLQDYEKKKTESCLEWLRTEREMDFGYIDFFGVLLRNQAGECLVPHLMHTGSLWYLSAYPIDRPQQWRPWHVSALFPES